MRALWDSRSGVLQLQIVEYTPGMHSMVVPHLACCLVLLLDQQNDYRQPLHRPCQPELLGGAGCAL